MPTATTVTSCVSSTFTLNSVADATALADCSSLVGDVLVGPGFPNIDMSGPTHISGDLILENNWDVTSLESSSLITITGALVLTNLTLLSTLEMPALTSIGSIQFQSLPALTDLNFTSGITTVDSISIADTFLSSLNSIRPPSVGELRITDNRRLMYLSLPVRNVTRDLTVRRNGAYLGIYLPFVALAKQMNISQVSSFGAPQLETIEEFAQFDDNHFTSLTAPALENCGDLIIANGVNLTNISLPSLTTVRGQLSITNNTMLAVIDGFKNLATVDADIRVRGLLSE